MWSGHTHISCVDSGPLLVKKSKEFSPFWRFGKKVEKPTRWLGFKEFSNPRDPIFMIKKDSLFVMRVSDKGGMKG
jgi:hypothetical protein